MKHRHLLAMIMVVAPTIATAQQASTAPDTARSVIVIPGRVSTRNLTAAELRAIEARAAAADHRATTADHRVTVAHLAAADAERSAALAHLGVAEADHSIALRTLHERAAAEDGQRAMFASVRGQQWYQDDPADSLYRVAHSYFLRQEYRPAAQRYSDLRTRYPASKYYCDAAYYEAFSRYRLGTPSDLRTAYTVLDGLGTRCSNGSRRQDVPELTARINSALARLGDSDASDRLRKAAGDANVCDREERNVKIEALSALARMDPEAANPVLRQVLVTTEPCSAPIRRQVITLIGRRNDAASVTQLSQVARNDPDYETRAEAVRALGRMSNDNAFGAIEEFLRNSNDERLQREAAATLARSENPRAQTALRALIERRDVDERIRVTAINGLAERQTIPVETWKGMYEKADSDDLRKAVVNALGRAGTSDAQGYLLAIARNPAEPYAVRVAALSRIRNTASVNDLYAILQTADSRSMRLSIVSGLSARKEAEATDRLIDIAKTSTDPEVRSAAIRALTQSPRKEDPKVIKAFGEILSCCG